MRKQLFFLFTFCLTLPLFAEEEPLKAMDSYEYAFFKMLATLGVLIVFLVLSFWMFRKLAAGRLRQMNQGRSIKVLERRALSHKSTLYIVEFEGKEILLSESQLEVRKISEGSPPLPKE
jgi:flagellar biogenesis protein FliO